jgi:hypothetical protein
MHDKKGSAILLAYEVAVETPNGVDNVEESFRLILKRRRNTTSLCNGSLVK